MKSTESIPQPQTPTISNPQFVQIENLTKSYPTPGGGEIVILDKINLTIREDEYISVIGHSGCGKSTLLKIANNSENRKSITKCATML